MQPQRINREAVESVVGTYKDAETTCEDREKIYKDLVGFVPPRIEARLRVTGAIDPKVLDLQEKLREHAMYPGCFNVKIAQLMLFGMLLMDLSDASIMHGLAARRAGATWEELQAVINLCFLFRGLPAANRGAEILADIATREHGN